MKLLIEALLNAVESLLYLGICTRPDILYVVSKAAQKAKEPN